MDLPLEKDVVFQIAGVVEWYFEVLRRMAVGDVPDFTSTVDHRPLGLRWMDDEAFRIGVGPNVKAWQDFLHCVWLMVEPGASHVFALLGLTLVEATSHDGDLRLFACAESRKARDPPSLAQNPATPAKSPAGTRKPA